MKTEIAHYIRKSAITKTQQISVSGIRSFHITASVTAPFLVFIACCIGQSGNAMENGPIETGSLDVKWIRGSDPCNKNNDPNFQVHRYAENTYILRQNKCVSRHSPFSYLLFGEDRAILFDTGAIPDSSEEADVKEKNGLKQIIDDVIDNWSTEKNRERPELTVAHFHNHADHLYADPQFEDDDSVVVVGTGAEAVAAFFGVSDWPNNTATFELGNRTLTVIPIPGHTEDSITIYDPWTQFLLTGDSVYPGYIFIPDWAELTKSVNRLVDFSDDYPVSYILGTHIEMTTSPGVGYGGTYQPNEHVLQLETKHLLELRDSLVELAGAPAEKVHDDFIIVPRVFGPEAFGDN